MTNSTMGPQRPVVDRRVGIVDLNEVVDVGQDLPADVTSVPLLSIGTSADEAAIKS